MYAIYFNKEDEGLDFQTFKNKMVEICNQHRESGKALAFAFIIYNFENAQLRKVLQDPEYWEALDYISGHYLSVFSLHYKKRIQIRRNSGYPEGTLGLLTNVNFPFELDVDDGLDSLIKKYFDYSTKIHYPAILFFQVDNESVVDTLIVELNENLIETVFLELKQLVKKAVIALERITDENKNNYKEIFDCLEMEIRHTTAMKAVKRNMRKAGSVIGFASSVSTFI